MPTKLAKPIMEANGINSIAEPNKELTQPQLNIAKIRYKNEPV